MGRAAAGAYEPADDDVGALPVDVVAVDVEVLGDVDEEAQARVRELGATLAALLS